ncbi:MAG TPA: hypothetical protein VLU91_01780 [Nitrososphaerales archaeon]|nr:hypothetical protein [Nitrososphaerales archaeon]
MRRAALTGVAFFLILALVLVAVPPASAQTQYVKVTPGYVNLGMTASVLVTAPASGSYSVVVVQPNGTQSTLDFSPTASGQILNSTYGNATIGFKASVDQVGTYNVYLEQGGQVVSATSFYATNKLLVSFQMVTGGTCDYVSGVTRGTKMFPHIFVTYDSNGAPMTNTVQGAVVDVLTPNGQVTVASWDPYAKAFEIGVLPNWNYTFVGPWSPAINASDAAGNVGVLKYTGSPFVISPVDLSTEVVVVNGTSGPAVSSLENGQTVSIEATITYPTNAEPVNGFAGPLNSTRGGSVSAQIGWGYYNVTSDSFGGKMPGGLLGVVPMTYTGANGTWAGQFVSSSLPKLPAGTTYVVVVTSKDGASPANAGFGMEILSPASSTATIIQTTTTTTATQTVETIPDVVYAALAILLIVGVLVGYIVRVPR